MSKSLLILFFLITFAIHASASSFVKASDEHFVYMGRISRAIPDAVAWTYPGVQIVCRFSGSSVSMKTNPGSGFYIIQIDDREPFKVESKKGQEIISLAKNLADGEHELHIVLDAILVLALVQYAFALMARYENPLFTTVKNAALLAVAYFPRTFLMLMFTIGIWLAGVVFWRILAPVLLLLGFSLPCYVCCQLLGIVFQKLEENQRETDALSERNSL